MAMQIAPTLCCVASKASGFSIDSLTGKPTGSRRTGKPSLTREGFRTLLAAILSES
jgi:hypothetical protein